MEEERRWEEEERRREAEAWRREEEERRREEEERQREEEERRQEEAARQRMAVERRALAPAAIPPPTQVPGPDGTGAPGFPTSPAGCQPRLPSRRLPKRQSTTSA